MGGQPELHSLPLRILPVAAMVAIMSMMPCNPITTLYNA